MPRTVLAASAMRSAAGPISSSRFPHPTERRREDSAADLPLPMARTTWLSFTAPDRFARHTLEPRPESMVVEGNTVTLKRGGRSRQMAVDAVPELTALIEAVRGTLSGDAATLRRYFDTRVEGHAGLWTLILLPRDGRLAAQVREIKIVGQGSLLRSVELWLAGGDRSLMSIEPVK